METKITKAARAALTEVVRIRHEAASAAERKRILAEFVAMSGYHPKSALRILNQTALSSVSPTRSVRRRRKLYDEAARQALIVLWEASDRICGKRLRPLLPTLIPSLERHGHLHLDEEIRKKILTMSAATIDRLLREPKASAKPGKRRPAVPELKRRVAVRTFSDWNNPEPGSMEMDLVAHGGDSASGRFVHSLVLTDICTAWTECSPLVVREKTLLVEALERVRLDLPFRLRALDVDNGSEFLNQTLIDYCVNHGIELTRSRPYRKNDQAWIEQKNGAVVRRIVGYRRLEGIAAAQGLSRLYAASRLFVNFFQPSFKLAEKSREGAHVSKRYHAPQTPCERLLAHCAVPDVMKARLRQVLEELDPLRLLEEMRTLQGHLVLLAEGQSAPPEVTMAQDLSGFLASMTSAWRAGEVRPTHTKDTASAARQRRVEIVVPAPIETDPIPANHSVSPARSPVEITPAPAEAPRPLQEPGAFRTRWLRSLVL